MPLTTGEPSPWYPLCAPRKKAPGHLFLLPGKILRAHTCWLLMAAKECPLPTWKTMCVYKFRHPFVFLHSAFSKVVLCCLLHWIQWMQGVNCLNHTQVRSSAQVPPLPGSCHDLLTSPLITHLTLKHTLSYVVLFPICKCVLFPAVWPWTSHLTLLNLSLYINKRGIMILFIPRCPP